MTNPFVKATKTRAKLRLALDGPAGSGKTYTSLVTAAAIAGDGRVAVIDTERGSASLYAGTFDFDVLELSGNYDPARYIQAIRAAESAGVYTVVVIDSLSHAWEAEGGVMEIADRNKKGGNTWSGWAAATPAYRSLIDAILGSSLHVIVTMRTKTEWVIEDKKPVKVGTAPVMRQGVDFEFGVVGDMDVEHVLRISKSRCPAVADKSYRHPDGTFGRTLLAWLNDGGDPAPPVWQQRLAEAIDTLGVPEAEQRVRTLLNGADPSILESDKAWDRLQELVANARGDQHGAASPRGGAAGVPETPAPADTTVPAPSPTISPAQLTRLAAIAGELGLADGEWKAIALHAAGGGITSRKDIPRDRYDAVEAAMREAVEGRVTA